MGNKRCAKYLIRFRFNVHPEFGRHRWQLVLEIRPSPTGKLYTDNTSIVQELFLLIYEQQDIRMIR